MRITEDGRGIWHIKHGTIAAFGSTRDEAMRRFFGMQRDFFRERARRTAKRRQRQAEKVTDFGKELQHVL